jgi:hypothetical protein
MYSVFKYQDLRRTVENKTFLLEEGFVSDSERSQSSGRRVKIQIQRSALPKNLVEMTGIEPATP